MGQATHISRAAPSSAQFTSLLKTKNLSMGGFFVKIQPLTPPSLAKTRAGVRYRLAPELWL